MVGSELPFLRLATGSISFATLYLGQKYFTRQIKGMKTSNIIISSTIFSLITSKKEGGEFINFSCVEGYLIVSAKLDECNKNFRKANTGRYGETWSDKIEKLWTSRGEARCELVEPTFRLLLQTRPDLSRISDPR